MCNAVILQAVGLVFTGGYTSLQDEIGEKDAPGYICRNRRDI